MKPTKQLEYQKGLGAALATINAKRSDLYSWIAKTTDTFVFTAEIDHKDKENNIYKHAIGEFLKNVRPISKESGDAHQTVRHAHELFEAINLAFENKQRNYLILVKGTMYGTSEGNIKAAVEGSYWVVTQFSGSVENGFSFKLERVE